LCPSISYANDPLLKTSRNSGRPWSCVVTKPAKLGRD